MTIPHHSVVFWCAFVAEFASIAALPWAFRKNSRFGIYAIIGAMAVAGFVIVALNGIG